MAELPHFNPDQDGEPLPEAAAELRTGIHAADAALLSVPEYVGAAIGENGLAVIPLSGTGSTRS